MTKKELYNAIDDILDLDIENKEDRYKYINTVGLPYAARQCAEIIFIRDVVGSSVPIIREYLLTLWRQGYYEFEKGKRGDINE